MKIGEAYLETKVSTAGLKSDLKVAENISKGAIGKMQSIFSTLKIALPAITAGAVLYGLKNIVSETAKAGDMFDKMSQRVGVSVEELSALKYVADISGTSIESLEMSLRYLSQRMYDVKKGSGEVKNIFDELGISVFQTDGKMKSTTDVMREVADKLSTMEDETLKAAYAAEIFGARSGTQLLPMLNMGSAGIDDLTKKAERLGVVFTTEGAAKSAEFEDAMTDLKGATGGLAKELGLVLIPGLTSVATMMTDIIVKYRDWGTSIEELNKGLEEQGINLEEYRKNLALLIKTGGEPVFPTKLEEDFKKMGVKPVPITPVIRPRMPKTPIIPIGDYYTKLVKDIDGTIRTQMIYFKEMEKEYAPEIFTPEEKAKYLFELPSEEIEDYSEKIKSIELPEPIEFWAEKQKEVWESASRDFENIFYNPFTDRITSIRDIWGQTCDFMRKRFAKALSDMITESATFKRLTWDFEQMIVGMFKQGGWLRKASTKFTG